jgi:TonB family protein
MVMALVAKDGAVQETAIVEPVSLELDAAAVRSVEQWRFRPASLHGNPIAVRVTVPVKFTIGR